MKPQIAMILKEWCLDRVPRQMRSWSFLRKYYWQPEEIDEINREVEQLKRFLGIS